ncbi:hypothetical protein [Streptomyces sp. NPDC008125]|uniref:hypothetical protein n=1 Tax=Streptomyces sp. NPDC008125 TaxID=3364811 RepID=UPI0036EB0D2A
MTIQLDGLGRQLSELKTDPRTQEASDGPVFVDESGRRSKNFRRAGWLVALGCAAFATVLVLSLLGGSSAAPWLPLTSQEQQKSGDKEKDADAPSVDPSAPAGVSGATDPGATTGPTPDAGATGNADPAGTDPSTSTSVAPSSAVNPAASATAGRPAGSGASSGGTSARPSASASAPPTDTTTDPVDPPVTPEDPAASATTDPTATPESSIP